jgi:hypothetical protein
MLRGRWILMIRAGRPVLASGIPLDMTNLEQSKKGELEGRKDRLGWPCAALSRVRVARIRVILLATPPPACCLPPAACCPLQASLPSPSPRGRTTRALSLPGAGSSAGATTASGALRRARRMWQVPRELKRGESFLLGRQSQG